MPFRLPVKPLKLDTYQFTLALSLLLIGAYNLPLWRMVLDQPQAEGLAGAGFLVALFLFFVAVLNLLFTLLVPRALMRPLAIVILLSAAGISYYMNAYGVMIDKSMVQNALETDPAEVRELLTPGLVGWMLIFGLLPALLVSHISLPRDGWWRTLKLRGLSSVLSLALIGVLLALQYPSFASLFRNHREIRHLIVPTNYLYYGVRTLSGAYAQSDRPLRSIGTDAQVNHTGERPRLTLVVVGETARAENFSLNGYARNTNPELSQRDVIFFDNVWSCGTSTAESVPCMFSAQSRDEYDGDSARYTEGLMDVLAHAGIDALWRDNNSGCKGACDRIAYESIQDASCDGGECFDMEMLRGLELTSDRPHDRVIVLHQKGSHGPAYYKRYPEAFARFAPVCSSAELQSCNTGSIVNAYDNTILYTDHFLAQTIDRLKQLQNEYDTALIYMSDHGESLGESGVFLHGVPYLIAPEQQKHVPMLVWLSDSISQDLHLDRECLARQRHQAYSHDNLFHSVLGLMSVQTSVYKPELDLFRGCMG
ncbi:phosphoethanolamine--lipid A transferase [Marinobacterium sp. D7]|uniref:phosphoethanolamine transferase n=1 Tax=Marinobacterium ramblicola TaxID=2849041 RepID=UPI001C2D43E3|nr:phosphoethanolamine--lipid A transferase [Marinobacterium ramblicola]MBV1787377.1 phosphoethanolamine--lipid A transferase [Marinobacterium ramblicola]